MLTVKTQPLPSNKYDESVCGAGITAEGEWIRIYPFEWFSLPSYIRPQKYQWVRLALIPRAPQDPRPESYKPVNIEAMELGQTLSSKSGWQGRNEIVLPMTATAYSVEDMLAQKHSLALIKPKEIIDFLIEEDNKDWGHKKEAAMKQQRLFGKQRLELEKVPWKFSYKFRCDDKACKGHTLAILDWEIFELYKHMLQRYGDYAMDKVLSAVRQKWLHDMWSDSRDSYLYIGTVRRFNSPIVLGVYWPPKPKTSLQASLF